MTKLVKKILNESFTSDSWTFTDTLSNCFVFGLSDYFNLLHVDIDDETVITVHFGVSPEVTSKGINSMNPSVLKCEATITWSVYADELDEEEKAILLAKGGVEMRNRKIEGQLTISTDDSEWTIESSLEFSPEGALYVDSIDLDMKDKKFSVSGNNSNE